MKNLKEPLLNKSASHILNNNFVVGTRHTNMGLEEELKNLEEASRLVCRVLDSLPQDEF